MNSLDFTYIYQHTSERKCVWTETRNQHQQGNTPILFSRWSISIACSTSANQLNPFDLPSLPFEAGNSNLRIPRVGNERRCRCRWLMELKGGTWKPILGDGVSCMLHGREKPGSILSFLGRYTEVFKNPGTNGLHGCDCRQNS